MKTVKQNIFYWCKKVSRIFKILTDFINDAIPHEKSTATSCQKNKITR